MKKTIKNNMYILKYVKTYTPKYFYLRMLTILLAPIPSLVSIFVTQTAIDRVSDPRRADGVYMLLLAGFMILLVSNLFLSVVNNGMGLIAKRVLTKQIQSHLLKKAEKMDFDCFDNTQFYDQYTRAMTETDQRCIKVFDTFITLLSKLITLISVVSVLTVLSPYVILVCICLIIFNFVLNKIKNTVDFKYNNSLTFMTRKINYIKKIFYEPKYAQELRMGKLGPLMHKKFEKTMDDLLDADKKYCVPNTLFNTSFNCVGYLLSYSVMGLACWQISMGTLSVGGFAALLNGAEQLFMGFYGLLNSVTEMNLHSKFIDNLKYVMDYESKIETSDKNKLYCNQNGDISIKKVSFTYPLQEQPVLKNISMYIPKGKKIAIVGYNGSGKTTLVKLLLRLYDPSGGSILWDDKDYKLYDVSTLRAQYSVVFQNYQCYALSIEENITLQEDLSKDQLDKMKEATKISGISAKIDALPNQYSTSMSKEFDESGVPFSGGEQQKIAIARAFYENKNVIIMDEPSSSLDPIAEYEMNTNIKQLAEDKTVIMISHRLSTIRMFDEIYVMDHGEIAEHGTHEELMEKEGLYYQMFIKQASNYQ